MYYRKEYGMSIIYLIPANLYGPGDHYEKEIAHVIPATMMRIEEAIKKGDKKISMFGSESSREFYYVEDAAKAIVKATEVYDEPEAMNLGTGKGTKLRIMMEELLRLVGFKKEVVWEETKNPNSRCFNVDKMIEKVGIKENTSIIEGLKTTVEEWKKDD